MSEPEWTKQIDNQTICTVLWYFFIAYAIYFGLSLVGTFRSVIMYGFNGPLGFFLSILMILLSSLGIGLVLSHYLLCDRLLLA